MSQCDEDNRMEENMIFDGDFFDSGGWHQNEHTLKSKEVG